MTGAVKGFVHTEWVNAMGVLFEKIAEALETASGPLEFHYLKIRKEKKSSKSHMMSQLRKLIKWHD